MTEPKPKRCTLGVRFYRDGSVGRGHYDYSNQCPNEATGVSEAGQPRCEIHRAKRYVVTVGTSITITRQIYDNPTKAMSETLARLGQSATVSPMAPAYILAERERQISRMSARPATATDIERFEAIASQTLESVTVAGSPR